MTRRIRLAWPDRRPFEDRNGRPIRLLVASDLPDPALEHEANRRNLDPIDAVLGAGDLEPRWLSFLADAFAVPLVYVRGNHDRGGEWHETGHVVPHALAGGRGLRVAGLLVVGLEWPGVQEPGNERHAGLAWWQALRVARAALVRLLTGRAEPLVVLSHAPPAGAGDAADPYHVGFAAYRWILDRLAPPLWLHGHTTTASVPTLRLDVGRTTLLNATGSVLVELVPPGTGPAPDATTPVAAADGAPDEA